MFCLTAFFGIFWEKGGIFSAMLDKLEGTSPWLKQIRMKDQESIYIYTYIHTHIISVQPEPTNSQLNICQFLVRDQYKPLLSTASPHSLLCRESSHPLHAPSMPSVCISVLALSGKKVLCAEFPNDTLVEATLWCRHFTCCFTS